MRALYQLLCAFVAVLKDEKLTLPEIHEMVTAAGEGETNLDGLLDRFQARRAQDVLDRVSG